jgi:hypothetical protein
VAYPALYRAQSKHAGEARHGSKAPTKAALLHAPSIEPPAAGCYLVTRKWGVRRAQSPALPVSRPSIETERIRLRGLEEPRPAMAE